MKSTLTPVDRIPSIHRSGRRVAVTGGDTLGGEPRVSGTRGGHHVAARSTADGGLVTA